MSLEWSVGPYSATLLLVVGAVGFVLGVAVGSMLDAARARRLGELPSRPAESPEFWRGEDRSRRTWVAATSDRPSVPIERCEPSTSPLPSIALEPSKPPMSSVPSTSSMSSMDSRLCEPLSEPPFEPSQTEIAPDPMASMTDAEIDAMAAEVPVRLSHRRRKPVSGPKHTVHRL